MSRIVTLDTSDIRFPTSLSLDGSDAMNPDPDYSAAYVIIRTDAGDDIDGHSFVFTIGRGNDVQVAAIDALLPHAADDDEKTALLIERFLAERHELRDHRAAAGTAELLVEATGESLWAMESAALLWAAAGAMAPWHPKLFQIQTSSGRAVHA